MTQESYRHPITPPPHVIHNWCQEIINGDRVDLLLIKAAQWGANQELEACCKLIDTQFMACASDFRAARRPKPPSLKQQALEALNRHQSETWCEEMDADITVIRRALESLPETE